MSNQLSNPKNLKDSIEHEKLEVGFVGKLFGKGDAAKLNATTLSLAFLILSGITISLIDLENSKEYWEIIFPLITLAFGYIWGEAKR